MSRDLSGVSEKPLWVRTCLREVLGDQGQDKNPMGELTWSATTIINLYVPLLQHLKISIRNFNVYSNSIYCIYVIKVIIVIVFMSALFYSNFCIVIIYKNNNNIFRLNFRLHNEKYFLQSIPNLQIWWEFWVFFTNLCYFYNFSMESQNFVLVIEYQTFFTYK